MAHPVLMPKAGQSMTEGRIVSWLKKEGDSVGRGEPLLEIETDKANLEVEAAESGVLRKIFHGEGEMVPVLSVIGVIAPPGEKLDLEAIRASGGVEAPPAAAAPRAPAAAPAPAPTAAAPPSPRAGPIVAAAAAPVREDAGRPPASPLARRVARERGVDLGVLRGTGPGGRILRRDVEEAPPPRVPGQAAGRAAPPYPPPSPRPPARVPFEGMRKAIGSALQQSKQVIPHFYATVSIDVTAALSLKKAHESRGVKVSINDIIVRACALALSDEPGVNCRVYPDRIEYPPEVNIGVAVGSDEGLVVPVILRADTRDLPAIAAESRRIVDAALAGKLIGSGQGTFTISNLGMFGVESFTAIINPPEGAILAVGAARTELVPMDGGFVPRSILKVTLSSDHRAIDGLLAARFLARVRSLIEGGERL